MARCLRPDEVVDFVDGTLGAERRRHVDDCASCQAATTAVRETLALVAEDDVPEPSVLFWPSINARVAAALEPRPTPGWRRWLRWQVAGPAAALVALVVAVVTTLPRATAPHDREDAVPAAPPASAAGAAPVRPWLEHVESAGVNDAALALVVDLTRELPDGGWDSLGIGRLPDLAVTAATLTTEEQDALAELLRAAVERPPS